MIDQVMKWHDDGHFIRLRIWKSELEIMEIHCPHEESGECKDPIYGCLVKHFIGRFGLDCNAGTCPAAEHIDLCWTVVGDTRIVEECQLWFMPKTDEVFAAWLESKTNQKSSD